MRTFQIWKSAALLATAIAVGCYAPGSKTVFAHGGGGGHGGGGHEEHAHSEHHGEEHHEEHHEHEHHEEHHDDHHAEHHHDDHHWNHHNHDWHYANWGWGPGFWGGAALGYGLGNWGGWGYGGWGGNTYVDNSNSGNYNNTDNSTPLADEESGNNQPNQSNLADNENENTPPSRLPVDMWPELGISTFNGHNGDQSGLVVVKVAPNSPAAKAGVVAGDVILKFNGQSTPDDEALEEQLENAQGKFQLGVVNAQTDEASNISGTLAPKSEGQSAEANPG